MREPGVLNRIPLIHDEGIRRLEGGREMPHEVVRSAAGIIQLFIEAYHEKLEVEHLLPRFGKAGRAVTATILECWTADAAKSPGGPGAAGSGPGDAGTSARHFVEPLRQFVRMYRPHAARDDTVLFPAFRKIVTPAEYDALGGQFEEKEHQYDLAQRTPH